MTDFFGPIFLGNRELNREFAQSAAKACLEYGADGFGLDGLEGTLSCGLEYRCPIIARRCTTRWATRRAMLRSAAAGSTFT